MKKDGNFTRTRSIRWGVSLVATAALIAALTLSGSNDSTTNSVATTQQEPQSTLSDSTIRITREEAKARFGEEANRARALKESASTAPAQKIMLDEQGNKISGRGQAIPSPIAPRNSNEPAVTWEDDNLNGGTVADVSAFRSYSIATIGLDGKIQRSHIEGSLEDAQNYVKQQGTQPDTSTTTHAPKEQ